MATNSQLALEPGAKLSAKEARSFTAEITKRMYARWDEKIFGGAFMRELETGKLPLDAIRLFWKHWYSYPVEINNFHLIIYQRHQGFFARHRNLLAPYVGKISDELVNPSIPGHIQVLVKQGETFGVSLDQMVNCEVFPECRALTEFARGLVYEGSMIEWWARSLNEEMFGHWAQRWRRALLEKYKFKNLDLHYFQVHEEADLHEHEEGLMAHGKVARIIFETMLQDGLTWFRPGWGAEYCCLTNADYVAMFHDGIYGHANELGHFPHLSPPPLRGGG
jgi:pyrroloquinoline quinone (PQQ) biosynthesis protein C